MPKAQVLIDLELLKALDRLGKKCGGHSRNKMVTLSIIHTLAHEEAFLLQLTKGLGDEVFRDRSKS